MQLRISRDGQELGELSVDLVRELLQTGFLRPTDEFQGLDASSRGRLSDLSHLTVTEKGGWVAKTRRGASAVGSAIRQTTSGVTGRVAVLTRGSEAAMASTVNRALEDYIPQLTRLITTHLSRSVCAVESSLQDEQFLRRLFGAVYDCLPRPVCRFVAEQTFVEFCLKHRDRLIRSDPQARQIK